MLITKLELAALLQLADRAPKSMAEQVWLEALSERIKVTMIQKEEEDAIEKS